MSNSKHPANINIFRIMTEEEKEEYRRITEKLFNVNIIRWAPDKLVREFKFIFPNMSGVQLYALIHWIRDLKGL